MKLNNFKRVLLSGIAFCFLLSSCMSLGKLPEGETFKYDEGEIVYYKADHLPMLIEKQIVKKGEKYYKVIFKKDGELMENEISEDDLLASPPANRAKI